jgi:polyhydroxybutyrate depolymerase
MTCKQKSNVLWVTLLLAIASCSKTDDPKTDKEFRFNKSLVVDGLDRTYIVNLPPEYYEAEALPLVIALHGGGGEGAQFESTSLLTNKANSAGFIVAYPDGVKSTGALGARTWNAGKCCSYAVLQNINDVKFISELIDELIATYNINPKRVYVTGHSNGGMMSYRLACQLSGKIAAVAPNGCSMVVAQDCAPSRSVPILHMHSILDENVPYTGGQGSGPTNVYFPAVDSVLNVWSLNDNCLVKEEVLLDNDDYRHARWSDCDNDATIEYYLTKDGGHAWPGGLKGSESGDTPSTVISANDLLWDFFQQHELP